MFGKKSNALIAKRQSTLSIFTKTLADLKANTEAMKVEDTRLKEEQERMQAERDAMTTAITILHQEIDELLQLNNISALLDR